MFQGQRSSKSIALSHFDFQLPGEFLLPTNTLVYYNGVLLSIQAITCSKLFPLISSISNFHRLSLPINIIIAHCLTKGEEGRSRCTSQLPMNLDSSAIWIIVYTRVDNKEKRVKLSPKSNATIQLRFDALTCCMFANIVQANSSHVTSRHIFYKVPR